MKKILIFAGTTEGRLLLEKLSGKQAEIYVSVATEYGKECLPEEQKTAGGSVSITAGRMKEQDMTEYIKKRQIGLVIDATHPFAVEATKNIRKACKNAQIPYLRLLRDRKEPGRESGNVTYVSSIEEGIDRLQKTEGNIFITTGSKELWKYTKLNNYKERCFARVLSSKEAVEESMRLGFTGRHLIAMQGPFSEEMNVCMLRHIRASYMITKESGKPGGFLEKERAAEKAGADLIVVERPKEDGYSLEEIVERVEAWLSL